MATEKPTIAVLGAGNIGGSIGRKWINAGYEVIFGVNDVNGKNAQALRGELGDRAQIGTIADALNSNPAVVLMAIPGTAMEPTIAQYASQLDGRIIIDSANRMGASTMNSFAALQQHTPNAHIYRAFNTYGFENFANPEFHGVQADLFYCGPDDDSRPIVEQLISAVGLRPVYLGGVSQVGIVDGITGIWFALAIGQKKGRHLAFKVLER
ncbi:MAG TPA: NAD(P)-binding domain-containing protein [Ktedonobacteraceae bacterium]|nr:NAD(P)-binding domain-containing protein [Ktedonobacteraceae bacterium]